MCALVDTHCHLDFNRFDGDRDKVIERATKEGIERILNPGINLDSSRSILQFTELHSPIYAAVGVHPNDAQSWAYDTLNLLRNLAANGKVVAIGEIGLDYYRETSPRAKQLQILREQLHLAGEIELPVVIHNREATEDVLAVLSEWCAELIKSGSKLIERPGVLHSFSADLKSALAAIDLNFYIGITGPVTFRNAERLRQIVAEVPIDRLLVETDAPFLTPHPYRGKRNEPAYVRYVADKIAELKNITFEEVSAVTTSNAAKLFKW